MMNNDERILKLKEEIKVKTEELSKNKVKFVPQTNCILLYNGDTLNLNVLDKKTLIKVLVELHSLELSAIDLGINLDDYIIGGYSISNWTNDIKNKIEVVKYNDKKKELQSLEKQLDSLLSEGKQTELKIDALSEVLKGL